MQPTNLAGDDGDGRLFCLLDPRHLFDHGDRLALPGRHGEAVEVVLERLDPPGQLQLREDGADLGLGAAREPAHQADHQHNCLSAISHFLTCRG